MSLGSSPLTLSLALSLYSLINYIQILFVWNEVHASLYHTSFTCFKIKGALFHSNRNGLWEKWLVSQEWCFAGVLFLLSGESYSFWLSKTVLGMPYSPRHLGTIAKMSEEKNNSKSRWKGVASIIETSDFYISRKYAFSKCWCISRPSDKSLFRSWLSWHGLWIVRGLLDHGLLRGFFCMRCAQCRVSRLSAQHSLDSLISLDILMSILQVPKSK